MSSPGRNGTKVAIITGASSGLGRATAARLARDGIRVALLARSSTDLAEVQQEVKQAGGTSSVHTVDLADADALVAAVHEVVETWGGVDVLVNNAGTDVPGPVEELAVEDWDRVVDVNLRAPFLLSKLVFPHMRTAGGGTIVTISSVAGRRGWANAAAYCASKFALTGFTQALAAEGRPHGIRACVVYPGAMATHWGTFDPQERGARTGRPQPEDEALAPDQVAELIAWITSAPPGLVLNEVTVTPLQEQGWP